MFGAGYGVSWRDSSCDGHPKEWNNKLSLNGAGSTYRMKRKALGRLQIGLHKGQNEDIQFALLLCAWHDAALQEDEQEPLLLFLA
jgi:hypothetical protein